VIDASAAPAMRTSASCWTLPVRGAWVAADGTKGSRAHHARPARVRPDSTRSPEPAAQDCGMPLTTTALTQQVRVPAADISFSSDAATIDGTDRIDRKDDRPRDACRFAASRARVSTSTSHRRPDRRCGAAAHSWPDSPRHVGGRQTALGPTTALLHGRQVPDRGVPSAPSSSTGLDAR
jgi:hypothetical protein